MKSAILGLLFYALSPICYASYPTNSIASVNLISSSIEAKLSAVPEFGGVISSNAVIEAATALKSKFSSLNQVADNSNSISVGTRFKCIQIRGALIILAGSQIGIAACKNKFGTYLIKYTTRDLFGMPSTIGLGVGVAVTGAVLTANEQNISGDYHCVYKGGAVVVGGESMACSTSVNVSSPGPDSRNLRLTGLSFGIQAEYGEFDITIW